MSFGDPRLPSPGDLAYWIGPDLWEIELDGQIHESRHKVVARQGRLLRRVDGWTDDTAIQLPRWCAWRTRDRAVEMLTSAGLDSWARRFSGVDTLDELRRLGTEASTALGDTTTSGSVAALAGDAAALAGWLGIGPFIAACAAGHLARSATGMEADYASSFAAERETQSAWIAERLQLA